MGKVVDILGKVYGRLTVVCREPNDKYRRAMWRCVCECGKETVVAGDSLRRGLTRSCGCLLSDTHKIHGLSGHKAYRTWKSITQRVLNANCPSYKDYGGRGITVCDEWLESFNNFWEDMGSTWEEGLSIDRIDVNGNYCKENCRWATDSVQVHGRRKFKGKSSRYIGVSYNTNRNVFIATITFNGKNKYLGQHNDELSAATVYDDYSEELYGDRPNGTVRRRNEL